MFKWRHLLLGVVITVLLVGIWREHGSAQDNDDGAEDRLELLSIDDTSPVFLQALAPDDKPITANFAPRLEIAFDGELKKPVVYAAIENTGWSLGALGLISNRLDPDEVYVALELWERLGNLVLRDDGQGMIFPLEYVNDLDGNEWSGFQLDVVLDESRGFRIYRVTEKDGLFVRGQIIQWDGRRANSERASYVVVPEPVFADLLLDFHIVALPAPILTPTLPPTPVIEEELTPTPISTPNP